MYFEEPAGGESQIESPPLAPEANQTESTESSGEARLQRIRTQEEFEAIKGQLADSMGYDPRMQQNKPNTTGRFHQMDQLFTEASRIENHTEIQVWKKGNDVLGYAVVKTPPTSGEAAVITDIRVTNNTGVDGTLRDFLMALKADLRDQSKRDIIYKEAFIEMPEGSAPIRDLQRAFEPTLINEYFKTRKKENPDKAAVAAKETSDAKEMT